MIAHSAAADSVYFQIGLIPSIFITAHTVANKSWDNPHTSKTACLQGVRWALPVQKWIAGATLSIKHELGASSWSAVPCVQQRS